MKKHHSWLLFILIAILFSFYDYPFKTKPSVVVEMTNTSRFVPAEIKISKGEVVHWKNTSDLIHTVTCDPDEVINEKNVELPDGAKAFNSGRLKPGEEFKKQFNVRGTYTYFCIPHETLGMVAKVVVD